MRTTGTSEQPYYPKQREASNRNDLYPISPRQGEASGGESWEERRRLGAFPLGVGHVHVGRSDVGIAMGDVGWKQEHDGRESESTDGLFRNG